MVASLVISILAIIGIIFTSVFHPNIKIKNITINLYWVIALVAALALLISTLLPWNVFWNELIREEGMNPLKILVLFLSMTCISIFLDELGFFSHLANYVLKKCGNSQIKVFIVFYLLVSILTMFTSNDIIILTLTPFIIFFTKRSNVSPVPYLVSEFIAANTWSMIFIIGNPTNIYIASNFNIGFIEYFKIMALPTLFSGIIEFIILFLLFYKKLKLPMEKREEILPPLNKIMVGYGLTILLICTVLLIVSSYVNFLEMWYVAFGGLVLVVIGSLIYSLINKNAPKELGQTFKRAPYELIPFLLSMFAIALTLQQYGVTQSTHDFFGENNTIWVYGYSSLLSANLINNIPMSVLFTSIIQGLSGTSLSGAIYASVIGSNIGAFLTPLGALAGIMWMGILKHHEIHFSFVDFMKYGIIVGVPTATVAFLSLTIFIH